MIMERPSLTRSVMSIKDLSQTFTIQVTDILNNPPHSRAGRSGAGGNGFSMRKWNLSPS